MKKILKHLIFSLIIIVISLRLSPNVKAESQKAYGLVDYSLKEKTFYSFNLAYAEVMKLTDENEKNQLLGKLGAISNIVWRPDITKIYAILKEMADTGSGKIYDEVQVVIANADIPQVDKDYLLTEVTSWGKELVWTVDYSNAVSVLGNAWTKKDADSIDKAEVIILQIKNEKSRAYLLGELEKVKKLNVVTFYEITKVTYTDKNVKINYPQLKSISDINKQKEINDKIKSEALKSLNYYGGNTSGVTLEINYSIEWKGKRLLSIQYSGTGYAEGAAHPNNLFYSTNISLIDGSILRLKDLVKIDNAFVEKFKNGVYRTRNSQNTPEIEEAAIIIRDGLTTDDLIQTFNNADSLDNIGTENHSDTFSYFTQNSLGITISVPHAVGDYAEFLINYADIEKSLNVNNEIWKEFSDNKPSIKNIKCRLYFFNMSELKHYYVDKILPIEDNAIVSALTKELQSTSYNKNFLSLTDKVKIKSANLDKTTGILKIVLSDSYVDHMTLGTNTEDGLLTSLLATYGYNLGSDKIAIYFNDKLYTSLGDLQAEYFTVQYPAAELYKQ
jgi:hypothetical protein